MFFVAYLKRNLPNEILALEYVLTFCQKKLIVVFITVLVSQM